MGLILTNMIDSAYENVTEQTTARSGSLLLSPPALRLSLASTSRGEPQLSRKQVLVLLKNLEERKIDRIRPHLTANGALVYVDVAEFTGIDASKISEILESLAQEGILTKEPASPLFNCPSCNSTIAVQSLVCPNCRGTGLVSGTALQHLPCLNFDFESRFEHRDGFTFCPKCDRKLLNLGLDYLRPGTFFKCVACGEFTARALRLYTCSSCQKIFETTKEAAIQAYDYKINEEKKKELVAKYLFDVSLDPMFDALKRSCLEIRKSNVLKGKSGVEHSFTVVANYQNVEVGHKVVVIDVVSNPVRVDTTAVLSLFAKTLDCKVKDRILIAIPELEDDARVLARNYNITYIEAKQNSINELAEKLQIMFGPREIQQGGPLSVSQDKYIRRPNRSMKDVKRQLIRKRSSLDIMADILTVVGAPSSKTEVMACANLSYEQCQKYMPALEKLGLIREYFEDGVHSRFVSTEKGREYLSSMSAEYGRIAEGDKSVWSTRRRVERCDGGYSIKK